MMPAMDFDELRAGAAAVAPMLIGVAPFGLVAGATTSVEGLGLGAAVGLSTIVFAGASQLAAGDLAGFTAGIAPNARWHVNASRLPFAAADHFGPEGVTAFFVDALGYLAITGFEVLEDETIAARAGACNFIVAVKANESVASRTDPTQTASFSIREVVTVNCAGQITSADIYYDSGLIEDVMRRGGDI